MVVNIDIIPFSLQKQIAEQMHFLDFVKFQQSSKRGRNFGKIVKPTLDRCSLEISVTGVTFRSISFYGATRPLDCKQSGNYPRIAVSHITTMEGVTNEKCLEIIKSAEEGLFARKSVERAELHFYEQKPMNPDVFSRFLEIFNVTLLCCNQLDSDYLKLPIVQKINSIFLRNSVTYTDFLALKAPEISVGIDSSTVNSTLNVFLWQWSTNERNIDKCSVTVGYRNKLNPEILFSGLQCFTIWNRESHDTSILSGLMLEELGCIYHSCCCFYSLRRGDKSLFIDINQISNQFTAYEVSDEMEEKELLFAKLPSYVYRKLTVQNCHQVKLTGTAEPRSDETGTAACKCNCCIL